MTADTGAVEHALVRMGAAFRLTRLYPATHPAVAEAMAQLEAALRALAPELPVELRVVPHGVQWRGLPVAARSAQLAEFAGLLYARGFRAVSLGSGTGLEHVQALFAAATGAGAHDAPSLGPVELSRTRRPSQRLTVDLDQRTLTGSPAAAGATVPRPSAGIVFRPDAVPVDIALRRALEAVRGAREPAALSEALARLEALAPELLQRRDATLAAEGIDALRAMRPVGEEAGAAFDRAALAIGGGDMLDLLLARLGDGRTPPEEAEVLVRVVGALAPKVADRVVPAYVAAPAELRGPFRAAMRSAGDRATGALEQRLADADPAIAAAAAEFIGLAHSARAIELLAPLARHPDARVREAALDGMAEAAGRAATRTAIPALRDESAAVRAAAARAVGASGDESAVPLLARRADEEEDEGALADLLRAVGRLGGPAALDVLGRYAHAGGLLRRRTPFVRSAAVTALGDLRTPEARALLQQYSKDREPAVRRAAEAAMR